MALSALLQFAAAFLALRLIQLTGKHKAWVIITIALFLMGIERTVTLFSNTPTNPVTLWSALFISIFMITGLTWLIPLFLTIKQLQSGLKESEVALRQSEERFHQVISSISDHIYVTEITQDKPPTNLYLSPHAETLTGYPHANFINDWQFWALHVIHPDDRAIAAKQAARLAKGQNSEEEYRMVRSNGRVIWVRDSARVQEIGQSKVVYGLVSDITQRKETDAKIHKLNEELEKRVADRTRELSALYEVTAVSSESLTLETTLERSLERVLAAMRSNVGVIHLLSENEEHPLHLTAQQGLSPDIVAQAGSISPDNALVTWVLNHGEPLLVPNLAQDKRSPQMARLSNLQTYVGAPIRAGGRVLGVLNVLGDTEQQFNIEEVALLASIADQVGVAVENARLRQRAKQAAVMEERERLARELHDSLTQSLYSLTLFAEAGSELIDTQQLEAAKHNFIRMGETVQQALKEMRLLVHQLRPLDLEQEGLVGALRRRLNAVEGRVNIRGRLVVEEPLELPASVEESLYRIAQEALNNALKYAAATSVTVHLQAIDEQVVLEVVDNGIGFVPQAINDTGGIGLVSMRERAEKLAGSLAIHSQPGEGTRIKVTLKTAQQAQEIRL